MQAILTRFIPATNYKPSRIKASCARGSGFFSAQDYDEIGSAHRSACDQLCARFDAEDRQKYGADHVDTWSRAKAGGQLPNGDHAFCFIPARVLKRGGAK